MKETHKEDIGREAYRIDNFDATYQVGGQEPWSLNLLVEICRSGKNRREVARRKKKTLDR